MELGGQKQRADQQFREELRILATQIETINQQLATGAGGSGGGLASGKAFADLNSKLSFLYEYLKSMQAGMHEETKSSMEQVGASVNSTLQKNLGDIYAALQDIQRSVQGIKAGGSGGANAQDVVDIKNTLKELIGVYKEEVGVFKQQNEFLQKKLVDIERRLNGLEK